MSMLPVAKLAWTLVIFWQLNEPYKVIPISLRCQ